MSSLIDPYDLIAPKNYGTKGTPHDVWTRLREQSPVHRCEFGGDFEDSGRSPGTRTSSTSRASPICSATARGRWS